MIISHIKKFTNQNMKSNRFIRILFKQTLKDHFVPRSAVDYLRISTGNAFLLQSIPNIELTGYRVYHTENHGQRKSGVLQVRKLAL